MGIAKSAHKYGYADPKIIFSDDPIKDKKLASTAFPSLSMNLTPIVAAHGLGSFTLLTALQILFLYTTELIESALSPLMELLNKDTSTSLCLSLDAEWNVSCTKGVSIIQLALHLDSSPIFIIPDHSPSIAETEPISLSNSFIHDPSGDASDSDTSDVLSSGIHLEHEEDADSNIVEIQRLAASKGHPKGKKRSWQSYTTELPSDSSFDFDAFLEKLCKIIDSPPDSHSEYQHIKKDIFHAFHMIPLPINHGLRLLFLCALHDHLMRWDPVMQKCLDGICRKMFNLTFEEMLAQRPRFIAARCPCHAPSPSILVPALKFIFDTFGNATDAKTGTPLFNKKAWEKANAVLELAHEGYLSDMDGVILYEKSKVDQFGIQKWTCLHGTNKVEGGSHGDIYCKFGALHGMILQDILTKNH
ncbi:hypothetical protein ARMGADRAFT_1070940 [Armillaria gallica]|uniref:Uncharacterized protein n=1 Tax=Armillaria gallica TaxID=47427 RepID=A0A2H3EMW6_ARMGA|nr:hypothetical protein ARMGADRAFT_1070940 [Armillaria gallica]